MVKTVYYCDRCKQEIDYGQITDLKISDNSPVRKETINVNLCRLCYDKLEKFLKGKKE